MRRSFVVGALFLISGCGEEKALVPVSRPSILLVTLDTTRADAIGPATPSFNALAARGRRFTQAYATVPQTLPSHASMFTGLYPAGHGVRENGRYLGSDHPLVAERVRAAGYRTAAFVSAFAVARRFGLGRGFERYDEDFGEGRVERPARETTERAIEYLRTPSTQPTFLWVHYYDPHYPYTPPEPHRALYAEQPYLGEVASMDEQLGILVRTFEERAVGPKAIIVAADHGEGLGEHGEQQHGNLLYQGTMHIPMLLVGPGILPGANGTAVSSRRIFHTILDWAGIDGTSSLRRQQSEVVAGEAMKPFLDFGWQPQVMAVDGRQKAIFAGKTEVYDVIADPGERRDLAAKAELSRGIRATLRDYPIPSPQTEKSTSSDEEERRKLASLGYVASTVKPVVRSDAPRPVDMARLFPILDKASGLFVREQYAEAIPLLERILREDRHNLDAALRLATAHSALGHDRRALDAFAKAQAIAPDSSDVRTYLALHYGRGNQWQKAVPLLERIVAEEPDRVPALEALAVIRERQDRIEEAVALRRRVYGTRTATAAELLHLGEMEMALGMTRDAIATFERARTLQGSAFKQNLELGVLYLAARRFEDARSALDRVTPADPSYPMALFKRAQVSVLLREQDQTARIQAARDHADETTQDLIANERLFQ